MHSRWLARDGGDIRIPFDRLSCGVTILGEKGAGKSRLLFAIHDAIRAQYPNVPILIHDPKSEWYRTYYDKRTDLFFAPHFKGSAAWALWPDFMQVPELRHELLSTAVYAHQDRDDTFWTDQAVDLLDQASGCGSLDGAVDYLRAYLTRYSDDKFMMSVFGTAKLGFLDLAKVEKMAAWRERQRVPSTTSSDGRGASSCSIIPHAPRSRKAPSASSCRRSCCGRSRCRTCPRAC